MHIITIPTAVHNEAFRWQLDLFWFGQRRLYGRSAHKRTHAVIIRRNGPTDRRVQVLDWHSSIPHTLCESFFDKGLMAFRLSALPLNIQAGLQQILPQFADDDVLEVIDCDMVPFRAIDYTIGDNELIVCNAYERWHLRSLTKNRHVIAQYFDNGGGYYNGGFVPIIGKAKTFGMLLPDWIAIHIDILLKPYPYLIHWWAGMFALQAACQRCKIRMIAQDCCYIHGVTKLSKEQHIGHYSSPGDPFNKFAYPSVDRRRLDRRNLFYATIHKWLVQRPHRRYPVESRMG